MVDQIHHPLDCLKENADPTSGEYEEGWQLVEETTQKVVSYFKRSYSALHLCEHSVNCHPQEAILCCYFVTGMLKLVVQNVKLIRGYDCCGREILVCWEMATVCGVDFLQVLAVRHLEIICVQKILGLLSEITGSFTQELGLY